MRTNTTGLYHPPLPPREERLDPPLERELLLRLEPELRIEPLLRLEEDLPTLLLLRLGEVLRLGR